MAAILMIVFVFFCVVRSLRVDVVDVSSLLVAGVLLAAFVVVDGVLLDEMSRISFKSMGGGGGNGVAWLLVFGGVTFDVSALICWLEVLDKIRN
jgi:hypothetical protein